MKSLWEVFGGEEAGKAASVLREKNLAIYAGLEKYNTLVVELEQVIEDLKQLLPEAVEASQALERAVHEHMLSKSSGS